MLKEYIVPIGANVSEVDKAFKHVKGEMKKLSDNEILLKLDLDSDPKRLNKLITEIQRNAPEVSLQIQFDLNKRTLDRKLKDLNLLEGLKVDLEEDKVNDTVQKMVSGIKKGFESGELSVNELQESLRDLFKYMRTATQEWGEFEFNIDDLSDIDKQLDGFVSKLEKASTAMYPIEIKGEAYSIDDAIEDAKKDVEYLQGALEVVGKEVGLGAVTSDAEEGRKAVGALSESVDSLNGTVDEGTEKLKEMQNEFKDIYKSAKGFETGIDVNWADDAEGSLERIAERLKEIYKLRNTEDFETTYGNEVVALMDVAKGAGYGDFTLEDGTKKLSITVQKYFNNAKRFVEARELLEEYAKREITIDDNLDKQESEYLDAISGIENRIKSIRTELDQEDKGIISKMLFGPDGTIKTEEQLLNEIKNEAQAVLDIFNQKYEETGIAPSPEEYISKLSGPFSKYSAARSWGLVPDKGLDQSLEFFYKQWKEVSKSPTEDLSDDYFSMMSIAIEQTKKLNSLKAMGEEQYLSLLEREQELSKEVSQIRKNTVEPLDAATLNTTEQEAQQSIKALEEQKDTIEKTIAALREFKEAGGDSIADYGYEHIDRNISNLEEQRKQIEDNIEAYKTYNIVQSRNTKQAQIDIFEKAYDSTITKDVPKAIERSYDKLWEDIYDGVLQGQEAIEKFEAKVTELGYTFDETSKKWLQIEKASTEAPVEEGPKKFELAIVHTQDALDDLNNSIKQAFYADIGKTGADEYARMYNQSLIESQKLLQQEVDEIVKATQAQMEQVSVADQFSAAITQYAEELSKAEDNAEGVAEAIKKAMESTKAAEAGSALDSLAIQLDPKFQLEDMYEGANKERSKAVKLEEDITAAIDKKRRAAKSYIENNERDLANYAKEEKYVSSITEEAQRLQAVFEELHSQPVLDLETFEKAKKAFKDLQKDAGDTNNQIADSLIKNKYIDQITQYSKKYTALSYSTKRALDEVASGIQNANTKAELKALYDRFLQIKTAARQSGEEMQSMFTTIGNRLRDMDAKFIAQYLSIRDLIRYIQQAVNVIKELDYALIDLKKTTTMSSAELKEFYFSANQTAREMGVTTEEIINQAAAWSRLGYSSKEAATEMAALSSQFAQISPGMDVETATDGLVSTMKAFHTDVADVESEIMDVINKTGKHMPEHTVMYGAYKIA